MGKTKKDKKDKKAKKCRKREADTVAEERDIGEQAIQSAGERTDAERVLVAELGGPASAPEAAPAGASQFASEGADAEPALGAELGGSASAPQVAPARAEGTLKARHPLAMFCVTCGTVKLSGASYVSKALKKQKNKAKRKATLVARMFRGRAARLSGGEGLC